MNVCCVGLRGQRIIYWADKVRADYFSFIFGDANFFIFQFIVSHLAINEIISTFFLNLFIFGDG